MVTWNLSASCDEGDRRDGVARHLERAGQVVAQFGKARIGVVVVVAAEGGRQRRRRRGHVADHRGERDIDGEGMRDAAAEQGFERRQPGHQTLDLARHVARGGRTAVARAPDPFEHEGRLLPDPPDKVRTEPAERRFLRHRQRGFEEAGQPEGVIDQFHLGQRDGDVFRRRLLVGPRRVQQHQIGRQARDAHLALPRGRVRHGRAFDRAVARQVARRDPRRGLQRRHAEMEDQPAPARRVAERLEVQGQLVAAARAVADDQTVRHHRFEFQHAEGAGDQRRAVDHQLRGAPVVRAAPVEVIGERRVMPERLLLQVLRRQHHAVMPLDRVGNVDDHQAVLAAGGRGGKAVMAARRWRCVRRARRRGRSDRPPGAGARLAPGSWRRPPRQRAAASVRPAARRRCCRGPARSS